MRLVGPLAVLIAGIPLGCGSVGAPAARSADVACGVDSTTTAPLARSNDQTQPAGIPFGDTLDIQLDIRRAVHRPEGEAGPQIEVVTFGVAGSEPRVPGPLVRVAAGTTVLARVCNTLPDTVWLLGLAERGDTTVVPPGLRSETRFTLAESGVRTYRGITREDTLLRPAGPTASLVGAIVVDGEQRWGDRVLVISDWAPRPVDGPFVLMINGRSWPHTERLHYEVGDTARWIVVNTSPAEHPMHLHGFHFLVTARSDEARDSIYTPDRRRLAVTELLTPGQSVALEWVPERGGRWLFHCHIATHMGEGQRYMMQGIEPPERAEMHTEHHAERAMAGLVMGIDVGGDPAAGLAAGAPVARERLLVQSRPGVYPNDDPGFGYVLQRGAEPARDSIVVPGPPIVLTRGQPTDVVVVNRLDTHTAVHWHGLEIESYFDGVPGFSGDDRRTTPLIAPGDSFVVRIAPPRAGTYIYHSHANELYQLGSGLFGPVVVLEPGETLDPRTDHFLVFSMAGPDLDIAPIVANNGADPVLELEAGLTHRIRIINITADDLVEMEIRDGEDLLPWRILAIDGADVPAAHNAEHGAVLLTGPGSTVDVEIRPAPGDLRLMVRSFNEFEATIRVRPPQ